jgi:hypothetical protein
VVDALEVSIMSQRRPALVFATLLLTTALSVSAEPLFTISEDGTSFLYRSRPGDHPSAVATMFGIAPDGLNTFLKTNGITDPTRVSAGFVYRVPNEAVRVLNERLKALEADNKRLGLAMREADAKRADAEHLVEEGAARMKVAEARAARAARLERLWPIGQIALFVLALAAAAGGAVATAAFRRQRQAERYARALADEVEAKRRGALLERQDSARRILELEARVRTLEVQLGPRVILGGRSS